MSELGAQRLLELVLTHLQVARGPDSRGEYVCFCPFHADGKRPNLQVSVRGYCCFSCGEKGGLPELARRFKVADNGEGKKKWELVAKWHYRDEEGALLYTKFRWRLPDGDKCYSYRQPNGAKTLKGIRRIPYRLDLLIKLPPEAAVAIGEGEKCADALWGVEIPASTNLNGAGKWEELEKHAVQSVFSGRDVVIFPDNDAPGRSHAEDVARRLFGIARTVRLVEIPNLRPGGDVADWIGEREREGKTKEEVRSELVSLIEAAPTLSAPPEEKPAAAGALDDRPPHGREREDGERASGNWEALPYGLLCEALAAIAEACDGAKARDGMGFNRDDWEQGHLLTEMARRSEPWSLAEAKDAFRMANFYWKQLRKLGINSELLIDPAAEAGEKALKAIEEEAEKDPRSAIRKALESSETISHLAALRACERERFEAAMLRLREDGVKASEIASLEQAVKAKKEAGKSRKQAREDPAANDGENSYEAMDQGIVWKKQTHDGEVSVRLTNFCAWIRAQIIMDNGAETTMSLELEATLRERTQKVIVRAEEFASLGWVIQNLGPEAIVFPGVSIRDRARAAIQILSAGILTRHIYTHCGWRKIEGRWVFLHAAGAIGPLGPETGIEVSLDDGLRDLVLPPPLEGKELAAAVRAVLRFLTLGSPRIVFVAFCAVWRSALGEALPVDFTLHLAGHTGAFKTELAALLQGFFGQAFSGRRLPGSFKSTPNANERLLFSAKDAIVVIDEFAPCGTAADVARLHRDADSLLRGVGNRSARARLRADGTLRPIYTPRGLPVTTGEDIPVGHSLRARMLVLEFGEGDIKADILTQCQADRDNGIYAQAMSAFLKWLAPRLDGLKDTLRARQDELRKEFLEDATHRRVPETVASLLAGLELFVKFARETDELSDDEAKHLLSNTRKALSEAALAQGELQGSEEPASRFLALIVAALASGRCHLARADTGEAPPDAEQWGWRRKEVGTGALVRDGLNPQGTCIGWIDGEDVYLDPESAFAAAQRLAGEQETSLPVTARTLWKRLAERGYLASRDLVRRKNLVRRTVVGKRRDVAHLYLRTLADLPPPASVPMGPIGPLINNGNDLGGQFRGLNGKAGQTGARLSGPETWSGELQAQRDGPPSSSGDNSSEVPGSDGPIGPEAGDRDPWEEGII